MDGWTLFIGFIVSMVGFGYFMYGKKQHHGMALGAGLLMMVLPYAGWSWWLTLLLCGVLMALPKWVNY